MLFRDSDNGSDGSPPREMRPRRGIPPTVLSAPDAVRLIPDGATVAVSGASGFVVAEHVLEAVETAFLAERRPRDLTLVFSSGIGDWANHVGVDRLAHRGLVRRVIAGHYGDSPALGELARSGEITAYNLPQGVITQLFREIAAGRPGLVTHVGLATYVDPRLEGGKVHPDSEDYVELVELKGSEWLFFPTFPIDVAIIRGTTADEDGNITMEREALVLDVLSMATAATNSGGLVIAQVERMAKRGGVAPRDVKVPGILVDALVVDPDQRQGYASRYHAGYSGELRVPAKPETPPLGARRIVASRAAAELAPGSVANVGVGLAAGVAAMAGQADERSFIVFTIEQGLVGGLPSAGDDFGTAVNYHALLDQPSQFDFYDGGGLDIAFVAFAEVGQNGDVNVTRFGDRLTGCGGFIDITQNASTVVFCGTFTAGGLEVVGEDGALRIVQEGRHTKFVDTVQQVSFSANRAISSRQRVLYVTERAVFELTSAGLELREVAPGLDLEGDVVARMGFRPRLGEPLRRMPPELFGSEEISSGQRSIPDAAIADPAVSCSDGGLSAVEDSCVPKLSSRMEEA